MEGNEAPDIRDVDPERLEYYVGEVIMAEWGRVQADRVIEAAEANYKAEQRDKERQQQLDTIIQDRSREESLGNLLIFTGFMSLASVIVEAVSRRRR